MAKKKCYFVTYASRPITTAGVDNFCSVILKDLHPIDMLIGWNESNHYSYRLMFFCEITGEQFRNLVNSGFQYHSR